MDDMRGNNSMIKQLNIQNLQKLQVSEEKKRELFNSWRKLKHKKMSH